MLVERFKPTLVVAYAVVTLSVVISAGSARGAKPFKCPGPAPFEPGALLGDVLLTPTRIYVKQILNALNIKDQEGYSAIKGLANITGGGLIENIPRILPKDLSARLDANAWDLPPLFGWLQEIGDLAVDDDLPQVANPKIMDDGVDG